MLLFQPFLTLSKGEYYMIFLLFLLLFLVPFSRFSCMLYDRGSNCLTSSKRGRMKTSLFSFMFLMMFLSIGFKVL